MPMLVPNGERLQKEQVQKSKVHVMYIFPPFKKKMIHLGLSLEEENEMESYKNMFILYLTKIKVMQIVS